MITIEQKIAQKEAEIARLKDKARKLENKKKIIIGGMMLSLARNDANIANELLKNINEQVTKKTDLDRLDGIKKELEQIISKANKSQQHHKNTNEEVF